MEHRPRLIPLAAACLALLIIVLGSAGIAGYLEQFTDEADPADQSRLFWHLPLLLLGIPLVSLGVVLSLAAVAAYRGHAEYLKLCRLALTVLPVLALIMVGVVWVGENQARKQRTEWLQRQAEVDELSAERQRIESFSVAAREDRLAWRVTTTGGRTGAYLLVLRAENDFAVLYEQTLRIELGENRRTLQHDSPYTELFARCFDDRDTEGLHVCVPNAGTSGTRFRLRATLRPVALGGDADAGLAERRTTLTSMATREAEIDTYTEPGQVKVERITIR